MAEEGAFEADCGGLSFHEIDDADDALQCLRDCRGVAVLAIAGYANSVTAPFAGALGCKKGVCHVTAPSCVSSGSRPMLLCGSPRELPCGEVTSGFRNHIRAAPSDRQPLRVTCPQPTGNDDMELS